MTGERCQFLLVDWVGPADVGDLQSEDSEFSGETRGWIWHSSFLERVGHGGGEPDALEHLALLQFGAGRDVATRRVTMEAGQVFMESMRAMPSDVKMTDFEARASDGAAVALRWYGKEGSTPVRLRCTCMVEG